MAILLAAIVVLPRSLLITEAHSECFDARYHLDRGMAFISRSIVEKNLILNDPPLGEGLLTLPVVAVNLWWGRDAFDTSFYGKPGGAEALAAAVALWKAFLFLPLVAVVFAWCHQLYGRRSAWLAVALLLVDPTFAAHVPVVALDVLGVEGVVIACFLLWRYVDRPTPLRLVASGVGVAAALMLKHTAIILPGVALILVVLRRMVRPSGTSAPQEGSPGRLRTELGALGLMAITTILGLWGLTLFDVSTPPLFYPAQEVAQPSVITQRASPEAPADRIGGIEPGSRQQLKRLLHLTSPWPAGLYVHSLIQAMGHGALGHPAYLLGEKRQGGWWYYYPVVATYKVPIGVAAVLVLGVCSLRSVHPRRAELSLLIPALAWLLFLMSTSVSIGFRHFLPVYAFALMLASRCLAQAGRFWTLGAWSGVAVAALHGVAFHPDYLSYVNFPRDRPYLAISDSNLDWGQALKQVRDWVAQRPDRRLVSLAYFGQAEDRKMLGYYLGSRVHVLGNLDALPQTGLFVVSPVYVAGAYDPKDTFAILRSFEPEEIIGHSLLVYDLDRLAGGRPFTWDAAPGRGTSR